MNVRLGPFSASLKQFSLVVSLLGPVLAATAGSVSALAGALGTGTVGASALGAGALSGFALAAVGVGLVMRPLQNDFKAVTSAQNALRTAQLRFGKDSTQAQKKQEQLDRTLKGVSQTARSGILSFDRLGASWNRFTAPARQQGLDLMGKGFKALNDLMPQFAARTNQTFGALNAGIGGWLKGLTGREGRGILDGLMGNFNRALPGLLGGLGNIAAAFGRVALSASKFLGGGGGLAATFQHWSKGFADSVGPASNLDTKMGRLVDHAKAVGHFFMSAGRLGLAFFNAGANDGVSLIQRMKGAIAASAFRDSAIRRLQSLSINPKRFPVAAQGAREVTSILASIRGVVLQRKIQAVGIRDKATPKLSCVSAPSRSRTSISRSPQESVQRLLGSSRS
jgi:hypothetical protein